MNGDTERALADPMLLGPPGSVEYRGGLFILPVILGLRVTTAALVAEVEDADVMLTRLVAQGACRRGSGGRLEWPDTLLDKKTGTIEFILMVLAALGQVMRVPEREASSRSASAGRSHHRRPATECLVCRRLGAPCKRHGGPSRSTSFGGRPGPDPRCSFCRRSAGRAHAATCPRAVTRASSARCRTG